jgi:hypothetical protein
MKIEQRNGKWWITGLSLELDCGPYDTKAEAESDCRGMARFEKYQNKPGFMTSDRKKS